MPAKPPAPEWKSLIPVRSSIPAAAPGNVAGGPLVILRGGGGCDKFKGGRDQRPEIRGVTEILGCLVRDPEFALDSQARPSGRTTNAVYLFFPQGVHRIDAECAPRRSNQGRYRRCCEQGRYRQQGHWIERLDAIE